MRNLKSEIEYLKSEIRTAMNKFTRITDERVGMIDIYKDDSDKYIVKPILGEPEYSKE